MLQSYSRFRPGWHKAKIHSSIYLWKNSSLYCAGVSLPNFHLSEIEQGTKYFWCFNPTCQCAGAFAFICPALLWKTLHIWIPSIYYNPSSPHHSPPPSLKCDKKQSFLTFSFICQGWEQRHPVSPANHMMTAVISILKYETADHYH